MENIKKQKMTASEKARVIEDITNDVLNDKEFIYESMENHIVYARGDKALTFVTMIMKSLKKQGATNDMLKQCYEIASRDEVEGLKYMFDKLKELVENLNKDTNNDEDNNENNK